MLRSNDKREQDSKSVDLAKFLLSLHSEGRLFIVEGSD
jgi:hypothetical protein